jgi:lysophospholipase L1-like esterase
MKERKAALGLMSISVLVSLMVAEVGMALWRPNVRPFRDRLTDPKVIGEPYLEVGEDVPYTTRRSYRGRWRGGKGAITTNPQGFRTSRASAGESVEHADVLCMGDSFTFGYLVDDSETWPALLGSLEAQRSAAVINAGYYGGFTFDGAALRYRRALTGLRPRVLVYGVFPENDIDDIGIWTGGSVDGRPRALRTASQVVEEGAYRWPLLRESRLWVAFSTSWSRFQSGWQLEYAEKLRWPHAELAIRDFASSTAATGTRLIFVFLREPNDVYASRVWGKNMASEFRFYRQGNISILKAILTAQGVEWHDDSELLHQLHGALRKRQMPPLPSAIDQPEPAASLAARARWRPEVLAGEDGVHYSGLTNRYLAAWIHQLIESPRPRSR